MQFKSVFFFFFFFYHIQSNGSKCVIDVCRTLPTFEKTDLGHVRQQSVTWEKVFNRTRG